MFEEVAAYEDAGGFAFASFCPEDCQAVLPIVRALAGEGVPVWYDAQMPGGGEEAGGEQAADKRARAAAQRLEDASAFVAFVSEAFLNSHSCLEQFNFAVARNMPLVAAMLEDVAMTPAMRMQMASAQVIDLADCASAQQAAERIARFALPKVGGAGLAGGDRGSEGRPKPDARRARGGVRLGLAAAAVVAVMALVAVAVFAIVNYGNPGADAGVERIAVANPALAPGEAVEVRLSPGDDMQAKDFRASLETFKGRLDVFCGEGSYDLTLDGDELSLSIPKSALGDMFAEKALQCYLSRPMKVFLHLAGDDAAEARDVEVPREAIESVSVEAGPVEGLDAEALPMALPNDYEVVKVVLSEGFVDAKMHGGLAAGNDGLVLAQDVELDVSNWYYYSTVVADERTLLLVDWDQASCPNVVETVAHNLGNAAMAGHFVFSVNNDSRVEWEDPGPEGGAGQLQAASDALEGEQYVLRVTLDSAYSQASAGDRLDLDAALKQRLDAVGVPYAFGHYVERRASDLELVYSAVKFAPSLWSEDLNYALVEGHDFNWSFFARGFEVSPLSGHGGEAALVSGPDGGRELRCKVAYSGELGVSDAALAAFLEQVGEGDAVTLKAARGALLVGDFRGFDEQGMLCLANLRTPDGRSIDDADVAWMADFAVACLHSISSMPGSADVEDWQVVDGGSLVFGWQEWDPFERDEREIKEALAAVAPEADVRFDGDSCKVELDLAVDGGLADAVVERAQAIYGAFDEATGFEHPKFSRVVIYYVDEDNDSRERARLWFTRLADAETHRPEVRLGGVFANGRIEQCKDAIESRIEADKSLETLVSEVSVDYSF